MARASKEGNYDRRFGRAARWLLARGVHPNHFTFLQLPVFAVQIWAANAGRPFVFASLIFLLILLDGGDGILARVGGLQSRTGAVLDSLFDTVGIAIVVWGTARFHPEHELWLWYLFLGNIVLFLQNALLQHKMVAYLRGPLLVAVVAPETVLAALGIASVILVWLLVVRLRPTWHAIGSLRLG